MGNRANWRWLWAWVYTGLIMALIIFLFIPRLHFAAGVIWVIVAIPIAIANWLYMLDDFTPGAGRRRLDESEK